MTSFFEKVYIQIVTGGSFTRRVMSFFRCFLAEIQYLDKQM